MRPLILLLGVLAACGPEAPTESCVTNGDCVLGRCVNGRCAAEADAGDDTGDACVPWTCASLGQVCRGADDGCGGRLECGTPGVTTHRPIEWGASPYANWNFGVRLEQSVTHSVCFDEVPSMANGFGRGMYIQLYGGNVDEQNFHYGFRDRTADLEGRAGFIFSKYEDSDPAHVRLGPNSVTSDLSVPGVPVGVRMPLDWTVGCYTTRLERGEAQAGGDWMNLTVTRDGVEQYVGSLWFARASTDAPVTISSGSGTWTEFFDFAGASSDEIPRYDFRVRALGDDLESEFSIAQYNALAGPNSSCEYLASTREVRFIVGGDTFRCVPGVAMGDIFEQRWTR